MKLSGRVHVFGSINTDMVTYVNGLPSPGETVIGGSFHIFYGGKGANQAVAAARAGAEVKMYGCLGDDTFSGGCLGNLRRNGVDTAGVNIKRKVHSGIAQIIVDSRGENLIAVASGANACFSAEEVHLDGPSVVKGDVALFQNEIPIATTGSLILKAKAWGMRVIWNTAPAVVQRPEDDVLAAVDILVCNRVELRTLLDSNDDDEDLARQVHRWGIANILVTLGEQGSFVVSETGTYRQNAYPAKAVDTVGAGDCYCGVLAASLAAGSALEESIRRATAAASISITRKGAQTSMPNDGEIRKFLSRLT